MKKIFFKVVTPIFLSVICGAICGKLIYQIYDKKMDSEIEGKKIYLIQAGAYSSYDNMVRQTSNGNYVYFKDQDGLFKSIIGITEEYDNVEKIKNTYQDKVIVQEYYSKDLELNQKIKEYDHKISASNDEVEIKKMVLEMLALYKDKDTTLVQVVS